MTATLAANTFSQTVTPGGVVNAADYNSPVAPGSVIAIFGSNLAAATVAASSAPMPTALGGTSVLINGAPAPLFAVSPGQINAQLPVDTPLGTASLVVNGSAPVSFPVALSAPGIITYGNNRAIVINQDYSLNSPDHPALTGAWATVYLTGQGPVSPAVRSGMASPSNPVAVPTLPVSATIGGKPADVMFAGLTPGGVGLFQVNLRIPSMVSGDYPLVITVGQAVSNAPLIALSSDGSPVLSVVRTIAYHQITSLPDAPVYRDSTVISGDGTVIAYSHDAGPNQIYAMNFDGTGQRMVDSYNPLCFCGSTVVISDDGSRIVSSEGIQIRQGGQPLLITDDNAAGHSAYISGLAIEGDGRRVFFLVGRDTTIAGTKPVFLQRGLYVIEGSGMRQIVGPNAVAGLLGITASSYYSPEFGTSLGHSLGVTVDGAHIVFSAGGNGYGPEGVFGVNLDGSGLHVVFGPVTYVNHLAISGNGSKVLYDVTVSGSPTYTGISNFDGTGAVRLLQDNDPKPNAQFSADGKLVLAYDVLYNTDGSGALELGTLLNWFTLGSPSTAGSAVMNATATRFVYPWVPPHAYSQGFSQLVSAEINPRNLGAAPQFSSISVNPDYAVAGGSVQATVTAAITPHDHVRGVNYALVLNGLVEDPVNGDIGLTDGGNGIFSSNNVIARSKAPAGPRLLRLFAWVSDAGGMQHGTLVDITPFSVVLQPPAGGGH